MSAGETVACRRKPGVNTLPSFPSGPPLSCHGSPLAGGYRNLLVHQRKQFPSREQGGRVGQNSAGQGWKVQEIQPSYRRPVGNAFIVLFSILKTLMHQSLP